MAQLKVKTHQPNNIHYQSNDLSEKTGVTLQSDKYNKSQFSQEIRDIFDRLPDDVPQFAKWTPRLPEPFQSAQIFYNISSQVSLFSRFLKLILIPILCTMMYGWYKFGITTYLPGPLAAQLGLCLFIYFCSWMIDSNRLRVKHAIILAKYSAFFIIPMSAILAYNGASRNITFAYSHIIYIGIVVSIMVIDFPQKIFYLLSVIMIGMTLVAYRTGWDPQFMTPMVPNAINAVTILVSSAYFISGIQVKEFLKTLAIYRSEQRTDKLLKSILPESIVDELGSKQNMESIVKKYSSVSVLFADIVGFTEFCSRNEPEEIVRVLNQIFSRFDATVRQLGLEKIKTIGDSYMAVGGLPVECPDHADRIADLAIEMHEAIKKYNFLTGNTLQLRIGIHTGPVVAGVIGLEKFLYDLWGDTVNIAARLESHGIPGQIHVSQEFAEMTQERYLLKDRGFVNLKGKGSLKTYLLKGPKSLQESQVDGMSSRVTYERSAA